MLKTAAVGFHLDGAGGGDLGSCTPAKIDNGSPLPSAQRPAPSMVVPVRGPARGPSAVVAAMDLSLNSLAGRSAN